MPKTFLSLPVEIRLQIYNFCFTNSQVLPFRPQRKVGWNRSLLDLSEPERLFSAESQPILRRVFCECKLTRRDHAVALQAILRHAKILCIQHEDFAVLQKLCSASILPSVAVGMSGGARVSAHIVKENLRSLDFSDKLDEIVCQPSDLVKLLRNLTGLRTVYLSSKHVQRYSGTVEEHIEFAKARALRELARAKEREDIGLSTGTDPNVFESEDELRRMTLRSPVTDGSRLMLSPALFSGRNTPVAGSNASKTQPSLVVVDLSLLVWQHFLYTGPPYKDHWRCAKMQTLLETASQQNVHVVMRFPNIEFDPTTEAQRRMEARGSTYVVNAHVMRYRWSGTFKGEMSTSNWSMRLRHKQCSVEYVVKQRRRHDLPVAQDDSGMVKCRHASRSSIVCEDCVPVESDSRS